MKINDTVLDILGKCRIEGNTLFLPDEQLERSDYVAVNKVLETLGGKRKGIFSTTAQKKKSTQLY